MTKEVRIDIPDEVLEGAPTINMSRRGIIKGLAAGSVVPIVSSCSTNPDTGRSQLLLFGEAQIAQMAVTAWSDMKSQTPQTSDTRLKNRVLNIWDRIQANTPRAGSQWDVAVFDTDDVNAFVMPGNKVGVFRGITELTENDDQLSAVLGHEVGHVVGKHAAERMSVTTLAQVGLMAGQIAIAHLKSCGSMAVRSQPWAVWPCNLVSSCHTRAIMSSKLTSLASITCMQQATRSASLCGCGN